MNDGVTTAREGEVGKAQHFLAGERTTLKCGFGESGEEVVAGVGGGLVEGGGEVVFE
jgi:hypothetical protein